MNALFFEDGQGIFQLGRTTRRAFLQQASKGLLGLFAVPFLERAAGRERLIPVQDSPEVPERGRVLDNALTVYDRPSFNAKMVNMYWRDLVFPIDAVTIGDEEPEHNRVWYMINNHEGYVHSGKVQPVAIRYNEPAPSLPKGGALAEVTVPFTDARRDPNRPDRVAYRLYYSALFWVTEVVNDRIGGTWYRIADDKYKMVYFANTRHLRLLTEEDVAPISPNVLPEAKRLEVRLSDQVVVAYEEDRPVFMARIASGGRFIEGDYSTKPGRYMTNRKRASRHMAAGDLAAPSSYDLPGVPWVSYLTRSGVSFHGTYWHNDFGRPRSHGCLNLSPQAAQWVYRWSTPSVPLGKRVLEKFEGTVVDIIE